MCEEVVGPASEISLIISAWRSHTKRLDVIDSVSYSAPQLERWATDVAESLELLSSLREATAPLRASTRTVAEIFDDIIMRDRVHQLCAVNQTEEINEGEEL